MIQNTKFRKIAEFKCREVRTPQNRETLRVVKISCKIKVLSFFSTLQCSDEVK